MLEIEIKSRCDDLSAVRERLEAMGAHGLHTVQQSDLYLKHPCRDFSITDEALRIRNEGDFSVMHYKGPRISKLSKTREEISMPIEHPERMVEILERLGFREGFVVKKSRTSYMVDECEVSLDSVEGLGDFVEVEYAGNGSDGEMVVNSLADSLGVHGREMRSYLELLHFPEANDE